MIQGLPVEAERCLAIGRVMVEGRDENPMDDGPEGAQDEAIQDGRNRPRQAAGLSDDPPHERDKADREQEEEHETGPQDSTLMGAPSLRKRARLRRNAFTGPTPSRTSVGSTNKVAMGQPYPRTRDTNRPPASERIEVNRSKTPTVAARNDQTRIWKKLAFAAAIPSNTYGLCP